MQLQERDFARALDAASAARERIDRPPVSGTHNARRLPPAELDNLSRQAEPRVCNGRIYTEVCEEFQRIVLALERPRDRGKQHRETI